MNKGNSNAEGLIILAVLVIIVVILPTVSRNVPRQNTNTSGNPVEGNIISPTSPYSRDISIGSGNGAYSYQPYEEYITIYNYGSNPVDITNWQIKNGKGQRAYALGKNELQYFPSDVAVIPQGTLYVSPTGTNIMQNIVLKSGETAIITTGSVSSQLPYKITSFKENKCSGYLESMSEYSFTPSLNMSCPRPADEPGVSGLDTECRNFINGMSSCRVPEFETRDAKGEICRNCVDGYALSSACIAFIKSHFNYGSCVLNHRNDANFSGNTWRVYLGKGWEMWANQYESIQLFDTFGRLVNSQNY